MPTKNHKTVNRSPFEKNKKNKCTQSWINNSTPTTSNNKEMLKYLKRLPRQHVESQFENQLFNGSSFH